MIIAPNQASRSASSICLLGLLVGNIADPTSDASIKYGHLFRALSDYTHVVDVCDVELRGLHRYQNAIRAFRWPTQRWREAFYKNIWAFQQRSRKARRLIQQYSSQTDVVLQHGTIFSANSGPASPRTIVYTDFTYPLVQREDPWRDPFSPRESERWNELEMDAAKEAAFVLTRSEYARRSFILDYGIDPSRVVSVGGGVNFERLPPPTPLSDVPRILFIGIDFERKGGPQLVNAFNEVRTRVPAAELWMITMGTDCTGPGIRHFPPTRDRSKIAELYRASSIFAMPSHCETWGDVFLEAMAYGLPCIGSTNDAMPEIIQDGVTGYVVAPDDVEALANRLELLLLDRQRCLEYGRAGRQRVEAEFTWEHVARRMLPYLERAKNQYVTKV